MNMHGIMTPAESERLHRPGRVEQVRAWLWQRRVFGCVVVLPILLLTAYLFLVASDQYETEAHYLVRSANTVEMPTTGVSQALSMVTGGGSGQNEAMSVADYLTSHDAVATLRRDGRLVEKFSRPDADFFSRLGNSQPTPEQLLKYYRKQVDVHFDSETGITTLKVRSFQPEDSYDIARRLLRLGEQRVNILNQRSYHDAIDTAERQVLNAERDLEQVQRRLTSFRQSREDIDPQASGTAQIGLVSTMTGQLAASRAQLQAMGRLISTSSPQYQAVAAKVRALEGQVGVQSGRLTGNDRAIANDIGGYEELKVRQSFLAKRFEASSASLDKARDNALRQQLYLVRVVNPNLPVKSLYPQRWRILGTAAIALMLAYSIGWLIVAGVREHSA